MDKEVAVLNELIETSKDGQNGFAQAAEKVHDARLKSVLTERAATCAAAARELQDLVTTLGGKPDDHGHISGAIHRGWLDLKTLTGGDVDLKVLDEVERGEDVAKAAYSKALQVQLSAPVRSVVERQYQGAVRNHDRVRDLRNELRHAA